jgi:hypothetical protein
MSEKPVLVVNKMFDSFATTLYRLRRDADHKIKNLGPSHPISRSRSTS